MGCELSCIKRLAKVRWLVGTASVAAEGQASKKGELIQRGQIWSFQGPKASYKRKSCRVVLMIFSAIDAFHHLFLCR